MAFLRAINLGQHNRIKMVDLAALFAAGGCQDVTSYLQTGNVFFTAPTGQKRDAITATLESMLVAHGMRNVDVLLRTPDELAALLGRAPFAGLDPDGFHFSVSFLKSAPRATPIERLTRQGAEVRYLDDSVLCLSIPRSSKLTGGASTVIDKPWGTASTTRWWNVVEAVTARALALE